MDVQQIQNFLIKISAINKQFDKIAELKGENFNIFEILGLSTNEVRTHSAFLAELLDSKGSHGQKELFLKLFCEKLSIKNFSIDQSRVDIEKHIGFISQDYDEGGYIDIIITDINNRAIIIENKIYAGDQKKQLSRYFKFGEKNCSSFELIYLTLDGKSPSDNSCEGIRDKSTIINIAYAKEIKEWLELCKEKAVDHPILRETITQYILLVRNLTGQTTNNDMKAEVVSKIVSNEENLNAFFYLQNTDLYLAVKMKLMDKFKLQLEAVAVKFNLQIGNEPLDKLGFASESDVKFHFSKPNNQGFYLDFGFCTNHSQFQYGIFCNIEYTSKYKDQLTNILGHRLNGFDNWVWVQNFEPPYKDWTNKSEPWLAILDGSLAKNISTKIEKMILALKELNIEI